VAPEAKRAERMIVAIDLAALYGASTKQFVLGAAEFARRRDVDARQVVAAASY
jgi:hypothetical protein